MSVTNKSLPGSGQKVTLGRSLVGLNSRKWLILKAFISPQKFVQSCIVRKMKETEKVNKAKTFRTRPTFSKVTKCDSFSFIMLSISVIIYRFSSLTISRTIFWCWLVESIRFSLFKCARSNSTDILYFSLHITDQGSIL